MPSSPETGLRPRPEPQRWEPAEVTGPGVVVAAVGPVTPVLAPARFEADTVPAPVSAPPVLFELAGPAAIPEDVLAPARAAAEAAGYAAGWGAGIKAARLVGEAELHSGRAQAERELRQRRELVATTMATVLAAADQLRQREVATAEHIEDLIISSAFSLAEAIIGASLRDDATRGATAVTRALALVPAGDTVTVAVGPADYDVLTATGSDFGPRVELVLDRTLRPGDAIARSGATTVDARIEAGLDRAREVLAR